MELRVPVLFLDLNSLSEEEEEETFPCPPSQLFGEKPETMIDIPIIKREENDVRQHREKAAAVMHVYQLFLSSFLPH